MKWITGEDITIKNQAKDANGVFYFAMNLCEGNFMPGGPKCTCMGQTVDCLTFGSEGGGISGQILVNILEYFDSIDLFPRVPVAPSLK